VKSIDVVVVRDAFFSQQSIFFIAVTVTIKELFEEAF